jgi:hypothetical protein
MAMEQNKWLDISSEASRSYVYPDHTYTVVGPKEIHISPSSQGGHAHCIKTTDGRGIYVAPGWKAIEWTPNPGTEIFVEAAF